MATDARAGAAPPVVTEPDPDPDRPEASDPSPLEPIPLRTRIARLGWRPDAYVRAFNDALTARMRGDADLGRLRRGGAQIGDNVFINRSARLDGSALWLITIGDQSVIGPAVTILAHDATTRRRLGYSIVAPVRIGARVFIGAGSVLLPGVTVGDDTIVGAGSVVRGDVPARSVAVGNPVRVVSAIDDYAARHLDLMARKPCWSAAEWAEASRSPSAHRDRIVEALGRGHGYVE